MLYFFLKSPNNEEKNVIVYLFFMFLNKLFSKIILVLSLVENMDFDIVDTCM
jgi:hypothetical protein